MTIYNKHIVAGRQKTGDGCADGARQFGIGIQDFGFRVMGSGISNLNVRGLLLIIIALAVQGLLGVAVSIAQSPDAAITESQWKAPSAKDVKSKAMDWLREKNLDKTVLAKAEIIWAQTSEQSKEEELLASLAATFALGDANSEKIVTLCSQPRGSLVLSEQTWLGNPQTPRFVANNMRLFYARWLVQELLFEEAREQIVGLEPSDVVAPATLLFYQSVVYHKLLEKESGLKTLEELLGAADTSPRRYVAVARLMEDDLKALEEDSLDHIARRMDDVHRRLDLGRTGPKVRKVEDGVIESLDKLIKQIEDKRQQQQQSSAGGNTLRPSNPAQDSVPMEGKGPGDVTKRDIGSESNWGDLPPKEREEALQQIGRDFPSHYRDVIEQYFKKLASEGSE
jgi:hypothetical protein